MTTNAKVLLGIVVIIIIVGGAWYALAHYGTSSRSTSATTTTADVPAQPVTDTDTGNSAQTETPTIDASTNASVPAPSIKSTPVTITYTDAGFSPKTVLVPAGTPITFVNKSSESLWVASNPHPVHTGYDGTSVSQHCASGTPISTNTFDECTSVNTGGTFTFSPTKIGTWGYHNHADHGMTGSITVTAAK